MKYIIGFAAGVIVSLAAAIMMSPKTDGLADTFQIMGERDED